MGYQAIGAGFQAQLFDDGVDFVGNAGLILVLAGLAGAAGRRRGKAELSRVLDGFSHSQGAQQAILLLTVPCQTTKIRAGALSIEEDLASI